MGKRQDLWHFPSSWKQRQIPVSSSSNPVPPTRVTGAEGNPAGLWPHPATQTLFRTISPSWGYNQLANSGDPPPCLNTKPFPLGLVRLTPQTLSSGNKGPLGTIQEPPRPPTPCRATLPTLALQIWDLLFFRVKSLDDSMNSHAILNAQPDLPSISNDLSINKTKTNKWPTFQSFKLRAEDAWVAQLVKLDDS